MIHGRRLSIKPQPWLLVIGLNTRRNNSHRRSSMEMDQTTTTKTGTGRIVSMVGRAPPRLAGTVTTPADASTAALSSRIPTRTVDSPSGWTTSSRRQRPGTSTTSLTPSSHSSCKSITRRTSSASFVPGAADRLVLNTRSSSCFIASVSDSEHCYYSSSCHISASDRLSEESESVLWYVVF